MAKTTGISWTKSTFNGFIGCSHALMEDGTENPLCENCYAERENAHWGWNATTTRTEHTGGVHERQARVGEWGPGANRKITSISYWNQPFKWDKEAALAPDEPWRVFAFSLGDIWDEEAPVWPEDRPLPGLGGKTRFLRDANWLDSCVPRLLHGQDAKITAREVFLHEVVAKTENLTWLLLTKRYRFAALYLYRLWADRPWAKKWIIFSAGTQPTLAEAAQWLRMIHADVRGISAEPLLGMMDLDAFICYACGHFFTRSQSLKALQVCCPECSTSDEHTDKKHLPITSFVDWVITGGESGVLDQVREMMFEWEERVRLDCADAGVAYYLKQLGQKLAARLNVPGVGSDPAQWPHAMKVREFPKPAIQLQVK